MTPVTLGGYPARKCARRTHNQHAPGTPQPLEASPDALALQEAGRLFEADLIDELRRSYGTLPQLLVLDDGAGWAQNQRRTAEAMGGGGAVIVNGRLPDVNGRVGAPDMLIRHCDGYLPADIKNHQTLSASTNPDNSRSHVDVSTLTAPDSRVSCRGYSNHGNSWRADVMQLSHYTRMLQELGFHPEAGPNIGMAQPAARLPAVVGRRRALPSPVVDADLGRTGVPRNPEACRQGRGRRRGGHTSTTSRLTRCRQHSMTHSLKTGNHVVFPAQFAADTVATSPDVARRAVAPKASHFFRPSFPISQILDLIVDRYDMVEAAALIRAAS